MSQATEPQSDPGTEPDPQAADPKPQPAEPAGDDPVEEGTAADPVEGEAADGKAAVGDETTEEPAEGAEAADEQPAEGEEDKAAGLSPWWYVAGAAVLLGGGAIAIAAGSRGGGGGDGVDAFGGEGVDPGPIGDLSVVLTWGYEESGMSAGPDLDIIVRDPFNQTLATTREGFALGPTPQGGEIDRDEDGACTTIPDDNGGGPERAFWPAGTAPVGSYEVAVQYTSACGLMPEPRARYTVTVYVRGVQTQQFSGTLATPGERRTLGNITFE